MWVISVVCDMHAIKCMWVISVVCDVYAIQYSRRLTVGQGCGTMYTL